VDILGCPFDAISFAETEDAIRGAVRDGSRLQVVPGNVDFVMKARRDPAFAADLARADLVVADGVPIVWAASLLGHPVRGRVSGTELVWSCAEIARDTGRGLALVGGRPGVAERAAAAMSLRCPGAPLHPIPTPMTLDVVANAELVTRVRAVRASIVLVALGAPRQERWVQAHLTACGAAVGVGIGSAFDIISGDQPRAPHWMQGHGLEWLYRMILEPRRLGRRYLIEDSPFLLHLAITLIRQGRRHPGHSA
jgi:N-acetylglucosaminyldiphosphoundecaprenol N-acetyl-beta-D-mannosaminyltransferase